jgi:hypothetical protein
VFVFTSLGIQKAIPDGPAWLDDPTLLETVKPEHTAGVRQMMERIPVEMAPKMAEGYEVLASGLGKYVDAGVRVLLSADSGVLHQFIGYAEHRELEAMVRAGMPRSMRSRPPSAARRDADSPIEKPRGRQARRSSCSIRSARRHQHRQIADVYIAGTKLDRAAMRSRWI